MATVAVHDHEVPVEAVAHALHHEQEWKSSALTSVPKSTLYYSEEPEERSIITFAAFQMEVEEWVARLEVGFPGEEELAGMDDDLRESFERWHTLLETAFGFCGNSNLCPRGYNRTLCIGCPHLVPDPRKLQRVLNWRMVYAKHAEELETAGNTVDARQFRLLVQDLDNLIAEMKILQVSIEDGRRKPLFLLLPSPSYDEVVIDAEALPKT